MLLYTLEILLSREKVFSCIEKCLVTWKVVLSCGTLISHVER